MENTDMENTDMENTDMENTDMENVCEHTMIAFNFANASGEECSTCGFVVLHRVDCYECGAIIVLSEKEYVHDNGQYYHYHCVNGE